MDTSFDVDGKVTTDLLANTSELQGQTVILQNDGKILVTGTNNYDFALIRYNPNGSLDTSFDADGKVTTDFGFSDKGTSIVIQSDNKIVMVGSAYEPGHNNFALVRYNSNGSLDTSFDVDGKVTTNFGAEAEVSSVALQSDGKLLVAGYVVIDTFNYDFALVRYNANGSLDTSFGVDGKVTTNFGTSGTSYDSGDLGNSVTVQSDGKILVAGVSNSNFALVRYNANGSLDTSFDTDGKVITDFGSGDGGNCVTVQSDGKIMVAGCSGSDFALVRYNSNGSLDTSFDGKSLTDTSTKTFLGTSGNDIFTCTSGNDIIDGGDGLDTAIFSGFRANSTITKTASGWTVSSAADGTDTLSNIERLQFADTSIAFDIDGTAGQAYRIYQAAFNRVPDLDGLGYWIAGMDQGSISLSGVSHCFINSAEFSSMYGTKPTNSQILTLLYENVLHRSPDQGGFDYWMQQIENGMQTNEVLMCFSESPENQAQVIGVIQNGIEYSPYTA